MFEYNLVRVDPRSRTIWNNLHDLDQDLGGFMPKTERKLKNLFSSEIEQFNQKMA